MERHFKFVGWCSSMNDFTAIVKLSLFLVKKKKGGGEVEVSHLRVVCGKEHIKT